ncbi:ras-related protein ORAB-1-like [Ylistrum balloti]|uniref:ras-related protein ORAB-1-like n=1 Tax=Ylistrum balloti TaxID=509963 RepID=UPI002905C013|nr:ras-related protein ORAB-1-like [Ylistrum balloti]
MLLSSIDIIPSSLNMAVSGGMNDNDEAVSVPRPYETILCGERCIYLNLMLLGDYNAGKTSFIRRFVEGTYAKTIATMGCDIYVKDVWIDNSEINLRLWDTYGGERYMGPRKSLYMFCHGVIIVYDVTDKPSFENIEKIWLRSVEESGFRDLVVVMVGTKCDLPGRQVDYVTAKSFADGLNIPLLETSSLTGYGIDRAAMSAATLALNKILQNASSIKECFETARQTNT